MKLNKTKTKLKVIEKLFDPKIKTKSGCSCTYIQLSKTIGAKFYESRRDRNSAFRRQARIFKLGLAPQCFFPLDFKSKILNNVNEYCYITEHVRQPNYQFWKKNINEFDKKLKKLRICTDDTKQANCGIKGNKMIMIDFDDCSH